MDQYIEMFSTSIYCFLGGVSYVFFQLFKLFLSPVIQTFAIGSHRYQNLYLQIMVDVIEHRLHELLDFANAVLDAVG